MVIGYHFSLQGKRHKDKGQACQDYSMIREITPIWKIAAVADGVSAAAHAQTASRIACETVCDFIKKAFPYDDFSASVLVEDLEKCVLSAMHAAANAVEAYADKQHDAYSDYDTTLVAAVYNGDTLCAGLIGDSGITYLSRDGELHFSEPMNDSLGHVYPLRFRRYYQTVTVKNVSAFLCATDGIHRDLFLGYGEFNKKFADRFIPYELLAENKPEDQEAYLDDFNRKLQKKCEEIPFLTDDLSVASLLNSDCLITPLPRKEIDPVESLRREASVYSEESTRREAFKRRIGYLAPFLTDEEREALYHGTVTLEDLQKKRADEGKAASSDKNADAKESDPASAADQAKALGSDASGAKKESDPASAVDQVKALGSDASGAKKESDPASAADQAKTLGSDASGAKTDTDAAQRGDAKKEKPEKKRSPWFQRKT